MTNSKINSILVVIRNLEKLDSDLIKGDLQNLGAFNHTYLIVTRNIQTGIRRDYFEYPDKLNELDVNFAGYYFKPIKNYSNGKQIAPAWKICFDFCRSEKNSRFIYLTLGVNAHINNDLAFSLKDIIKDEKFETDHKMVQKMIDQSLNEVLSFVKEDSEILNLIHKSLAPIYKIVIKIFLRRWRAKAWKNYLDLKNGSITAEEIKRKAEQMARLIIKLSFPLKIF